MSLTNTTTPIAVASRSFSLDTFLKSELLKLYSNVKFNDSGHSLKELELVDFLQDAEKAIVTLKPIDEPLLKNLTSLKLVSKYGVGLDNIDFAALEKYNIKLAWTGGVNRRSVAELALHFIIGCVRGSFHSHHEVLKKEWTQFKGQNLTNKTVGLIGLGHVGQELVPFLKPFNVRILAYDMHPKEIFCRQYSVEQTDLDSLLKESDVISMHLPHTSKTHMILNAEKLKLMKKGSFLVNTARGGLIDEVALAQQLGEDHIKSAAFDVFAKEPPIDRSLIDLDNFFSTAHIGGSSIQSIHAMGLAAIAGLDDGKIARPENFFNYPL
jgi:phosphoglycerate dehydrogenase-like enzyme